ncbi:sugar ABC transporter substrate-binding protein [Pseudonocardia asaccharolytica]|uniref:Sugar ABC transporter substrate-binding protein n=1 Tax=Pseudonocardia asaccharolytica DSM 44247 = NBRC 16224 TaxID=1123024 RepID=A0A511DAZ7_9PSEU|nr:sugar ABC transporter substrate-binding protein [Pseudonocardia asaccharolytica]GEL20118.1 sugar ABC transporter substrate-binding protein [Pseudonocardia asaccharolytica DSM 44247 = NBRC 16224]
MKSKALRLIALAAIAATALVGCAQNTGDAGSGQQPGAAGQPCDRTVANDVTLPTDKPSGPTDGFTVAMVRQSGVGDYFEQWGNGATKQIKAAGGQVDVYDARGDNARQVAQFNDAISARPDVIIVDHGLADSVNPKIDEAISNGIPVVVYDVNIANCEAMYISQDDTSIATEILDYLKQENPDGGKIAYVNVSGIAPLDSRDAVYQQFLKDNPQFTQVAHFGKYSESVASDTATEGAAALKASPDTTLAFAAYDELAKGTLIALRQNNMSDKVKVYGVDISTADIQLMTEPGSPWRATAATDPANVGAIVARAAIAAASGVDMPEKMTIPAALITQDMLREQGVTNMDELRAALPDLATPELLGAPWIPQVQPGV